MKVVISQGQIFWFT